MPGGGYINPIDDDFLQNFVAANDLAKGTWFDHFYRRYQFQSLNLISNRSAARLVEILDVHLSNREKCD